MDKDTLYEYMKDHTNREAAIYFGVSKSTIERNLKKFNLRYYDLKYRSLPKYLNNLQFDVLTGTMLGNATINRENNYYSLSKKTNKKEYVEHIAEIMSPFTKSCKGTNKDRYYVRTISSPVFKHLRKIWYEGRVKIIPKNIKLNSLILAHWYCNGGYLLAKRKRIELATNGFSVFDVKFLTQILKTDLGIDGTIHYDYGKKPIIRIKPRCFHKFIDLVKPYITWKCFYYKLDLSELRVIKKGWGANKLDYRKAKEIRFLYSTDKYSQSDLAKLYAVSRRTINLVINNKIYKENNNFGFGSSAEYKLILPYQAR